jgi:hypothetical protein
VTFRSGKRLDDRNKQTLEFLARYDDKIQEWALMLREVLRENLPDVVEQADIPAKIIGYCYGQK